LFAQAEHVQHRPLAELLRTFEQEGAAAAESAPLAAALQRLLLCVLSEQVELDYNQTVALSDMLPPSSLPTLLRFVRQGFGWHGARGAARAGEVLAELRRKLGAQRPLTVGCRVLVSRGGGGGGGGGGATAQMARVLALDPALERRVRLEWVGVGDGGGEGEGAAARHTGWRLQRDVRRVEGVELPADPAVLLGGGGGGGGADTAAAAALRWSTLAPALGRLGVVLSSEEQEALQMLAGVSGLDPAEEEGGVLLDYGAVRALLAGPPRRQRPSQTAGPAAAGAGAGAGGLRRQSSAAAAAAAAEGETARKAAAEAALAQVLAAEADTGRCGRGAETDGTDGIDVHSTKKRLGSPYYFVCAHAVRVTIPRSPPAPAQSAEWVG
jgi:hypothetical protein